MKPLKHKKTNQINNKYNSTLNFLTGLPTKIKRYTLIITISALGISPTFAYTPYTGADSNDFLKCVMLWNALSQRLQAVEDEYGQGLSDADSEKIAGIALADAKKGINKPEKVDSIGKLSIISELQYMLYNQPFLGNPEEVNKACIKRINEVYNDPDNTQSYSK